MTVDVPLLDRVLDKYFFLKSFIHLNFFNTLSPVVIEMHVEYDTGSWHRF